MLSVWCYRIMTRLEESGYWGIISCMPQYTSFLKSGYWHPDIEASWYVNRAFECFKICVCLSGYYCIMIVQLFFYHFFIACFTSDHQTLQAIQGRTCNWVDKSWHSSRNLCSKLFAYEVILLHPSRILAKKISHTGIKSGFSRSLVIYSTPRWEH